MKQKVAAGWNGLIALAVLSALRCAGDGSLIDDIMEPPGGPEPTLTWIQANVFTPKCTACHVPGGIGPMPLDTEEVSFNNLVNVSSVEINSMLRVEPFNPDDSYLVWKIENNPGIVGSQMPLGGPPLEPEEIALIREWIDSGAQR